MNNKLLIWDLPIRLFHCLLVISITYSWFSIEILEDLEQHFLAGYAVLALILFRIIWGFIGTTYARFNSFSYSPKETFVYLKNINKSDSKKHLGHNPAGSWSVFAFILVISLQVITGLFSTDDYFFGPLYTLIDKATSSTLTQIHHFNFDVLTVLIVTHVVAIIFYRVFKKTSLTLPMITGHKITSEPTSKAISHSKIILALVLIALCLAFVYWLANTSFGEASIPGGYYY